MISNSEVITKVMHPGFFFFPQAVPTPANSNLEPVQIDEALLLRSLASTFTFKVTSNGLQRLLNIAGDTLDFHLTFTLIAGTDKVKPDVHFAIRKDSVGHNEVLYWWYQINRVKNSDTLQWIWTGCAGAGNAVKMKQNSTPGLQYGTTAADILKRLLDSLSANKTSLAVNHKSKILTLS